MAAVPRVVLVSGGGGSGRTTVAAATARACRITERESRHQKLYSESLLAMTRFGTMRTRSSPLTQR